MPQIRSRIDLVEKAALLLLCLVPLFSRAQDTAGLTELLKECNAISDAEVKAACLAAAIESFTPAAEIDSLMSWRTSRETDVMTDDVRVIVMKGAIEGKDDSDLPYMMSIRCENKKTILAFHWNTYIRLETAPIQLRVDQGRPNTTNWNVTEGGHTTYWPQHRHIPGMIKRWFDAERIIVRTSAYGRGDITAIFDVSDLEEGVVPVREACDW